MRVTGQHLPQLVGLATGWVSRLHEALHADADPLPDVYRRVFTSFFTAAMLARVRVHVVEEIPNPDFYPSLQEQGLDPPLDFRQMAGLTAIDTVLVSRSRADLSVLALAPLLFHECVHVAQYEHLGVQRFMHEYVFGWAGGGFRYETIPLEVHAYELEARFRARPSMAYSVPASVASRFPASRPAF